MALTNIGRDFLAKAIVGTQEVNFDNNNAYIGVGDSEIPFDVTQLDLQAVENKFRKSMDEGYPIITDNEITFRATFGEDEANFEWNEWGIFNASTSGTMLNRVVEYNGTKLPGQTWILQVVLTVKIGE